MYCKGDFHIHTNASDGKYAPEKVVDIAKNNNLDIMAVTDHDTTDSVSRAISYGEKLGIKVIPGIELSTLQNGESIHILGYFRDNSYQNESFQKFLLDMKNYRIWRAKKIVKNLDTFFNIKLDYNSILKEAHNIVARPHIARAIISSGYNFTYEYIFENILNKESPAYVPNKKVSVSEGIDILKNANAVVILAHPILIKKTPVEELLKLDFDGLEAIYSLNKESDTKRFLEMAKKYNKIVTAGSDFHTDDPSDTKHGKIGQVHLDSKNIDILLSK